jgi:P-type Ca2+ transporter type 2C
VKQLACVESLGAVNIICTDKTGTLTKNEMTVKKIFLNNQRIEISGSGYEPKGEI